MVSSESQISWFMTISSKSKNRAVRDYTGHQLMTYSTDAVQRLVMWPLLINFGGTTSSASEAHEYTGISSLALFFFFYLCSPSRQQQIARFDWRYLLHNSFPTQLPDKVNIREGVTDRWWIKIKICRHEKLYECPFGWLWIVTGQFKKEVITRQVLKTASCVCTKLM